MMKMVISDRDLKAIKKLQEIMNRGGYASGSEVTELYNRVLNKNLTPTNCSSCIRQRAQELIKAMVNFERQLSERKEEVVDEPKQVEEVEVVNAPKKKAIRKKVAKKGVKKNG